jgi:hypothetical protein
MEDIKKNGRHNGRNGPIAFRHFGIDKYETVDPSCILARSIIIRAGAKLK